MGWCTIEVAMVVGWCTVAAIMGWFTVAAVVELCQVALAGDGVKCRRWCDSLQHYMCTYIRY